jgi:hypothetical protein
MKRLITVIAVVMLTLANLGFAEVASFNKCKLADVKGKQSDARLILNDTDKNLVIQVSDRNLVTVPFENVDKFSYEFTKKHRVTEGAIVMIASLGAGAIVMLTKSKSHWLYIDYHEQGAPKSVVLRMDKSEYQKIISSVKVHTGKEVQMLGDPGKVKD